MERETPISSPCSGEGQVLALWYSGPTDLRTETGYLTALLDP